MRSILILILILVTGCLQVKKSPFDFSKPSFFNIGLFFNAFFGDITISGTITGFNSGTIVLQNNLGSDMQYPPATTYQFKVARNTAYSISVKTNPVGSICTVSNASGTATSDVNNVNITCNVISVSPVYVTNGRNWNDYINRDFTKDIFSQTDSACSSSNTGGYRTCVHAGEIRKLDIPSKTSCTNLTASDNLGALNWVCKTNSSGGVTFYSSALKKGKYLSTLIDWTTNTWQALTITIKDGTTTHAVSNPLTFWTNAMNTTSPTSGFISGTVYLYSANVTAGQINTSTTDKVSIVFKPGQTYTIGTSNTGTPAILTSGNFNWIEGTLETKFYSYSIQMGGKFSVLKNFKAQNCYAAGNCVGIYLNSASNNYFEDIVVANMGTGTTNGAIYLANSFNNFFNTIILANNQSTGVNSSASTGNIYNGIISAGNAANGVSFSGANDNSFMNATLINNTGDGINPSSASSFFLNLASVNNGTAGVSGGPFSNPTMENISCISNQYGFNLSGGGSFYGRGMIRLSNNTANCQMAAGYVGGGISSGGCPLSSPSDSITTSNSGSVSASTFIGVPTSSISDSTNASFSSGSATYSASLDWLNFSNFFRAAMMPAASFPLASAQGNCSSGSCSVWDFSLKSTDTTLRNANITGGGSGCPAANTMFAHIWSASSQAACNSVIGASFNGSTCSSTILRNAVELLNDGVGNDNGLCEANEDCLLTPNQGAYQGHGNLVSASTVSGCADPSSVGIKLYQYESNGF
ncbi:MAG TPA: hypothetical protein PK079_15290 [Leptospiraceae bacterium]|nr:hypothetical protein [Leptospiraceae bacterium]HMX33082.1 hypothetical protein [Leptospiraceae bacterium]HMY32635.1 hypothetical protein [Leptospiraceae bacterium]HMZ63738.1 hypothetical protein [Leptospiraceae bacterium]HNA08023.1 hypothetical protein [Leptospiraceae bacterium]